MRLLIVSDLYEPVINGVATFTKSIATQMAKRGHEVVVIAPSQTGKPYQEQLDGFTVERIRSMKFKPYQNIYVSVGMYLSVSNVFDEFKPDIVHIQTPLGLGWDSIIAGRRRKIPIIATSHVMPDNLINNIKGLKHFSSTVDFALRKYGVSFYKNTQALTFPTNLAMDLLKPDNLTISSYVLSNGVDLEAFAPMRKKPVHIIEKYKLPNDRKIILFVGRVDPEKELSVLLDAAAELKLRGEAYHVLIVGGGSDIDRLKQHALSLGIHRSTTFTGRVSNEDLRQLYAVGDVYAIASKAELQCIAALEAMATGLPVVVVEAMALPELCQDGINGFIVPPDNSHEMAEAIEKVLTFEPAEYDRMSKAARSEAQKHNIDTAVDGFEALYDDYISRAVKETAESQ